MSAGVSAVFVTGPGSGGGAARVLGSSHLPRELRNPRGDCPREKPVGRPGSYEIRCTSRREETGRKGVPKDCDPTSRDVWLFSTALYELHYIKNFTDAQFVWPFGEGMTAKLRA